MTTELQWNLSAGATAKENPPGKNKLTCESKGFHWAECGHTLFPDSLAAAESPK